MSVKTYALTTRQRLKDFLGVTADDATTNAILDRLIDSATSFIEKRLGYRVKKTAYSQEMYDGDGSDQIVLKNFPVSSTDSFELEMRDTVLNKDDWETIDSEYYFIDYKAGIITAATSFKFPRARLGYRVSYTAGYDFDNVTTFLSDTEAGDLEWACWLLASEGYDYDVNGPVTSERIGDYAVTYAKTVAQNADVRAIIEKYERYEVGGALTPLNI